jgi:hypothetical protein
VHPGWLAAIRHGWLRHHPGKSSSVKNKFRSAKATVFWCATLRQIKGRQRIR